MKDFVKTAIIGGLIVLLPIAIFVFLIDWLAGFVSGILDPLSDVLTDEFGLDGWIADLIIIAGFDQKLAHPVFISKVFIHRTIFIADNFYFS